jgi:hypothetical protein
MFELVILKLAKMKMTEAKSQLHWSPSTMDLNVQWGPSMIGVSLLKHKDWFLGLPNSPLGANGITQVTHAYFFMAFVITFKEIFLKKKSN